MAELLGLHALLTGAAGLTLGVLSYSAGPGQQPDSSCVSYRAGVLCCPTCWSLWVGYPVLLCAGGSVARLKPVDFLGREKELCVPHQGPWARGMLERHSSLLSESRLGIISVCGRC